MSLAENVECGQTGHVRQVIVQQNQIQVRMQSSLLKGLRTGACLEHRNVLIQSFQDLM